MFIETEKRPQGEPTTRESMRQAQMKLSEAIREGCKRTPQYRWHFFGHGGSTCAIGAAMVGLFGVDQRTAGVTHLMAVNALMAGDWSETTARSNPQRSARGWKIGSPKTFRAPWRNFIQDAIPEENR